MKNYLFAFMLMLSTFCYSQMEFSSSVDYETNVCDETSIHSFTIVNNTSSTQTGISISLNLPDGIEYQTGSLLNTGNTNASESNINNSSNPIFSGANMSIGDSIKFSISITANSDSYSYQQAGNLFRTNLQFISDQETGSYQTNAYNILFPSLNILSINTSPNNVTSGEFFERTITITNAGYGSISNFNLQIEELSSANTLISASLGTLNSSGEILALNTTDFSGLGNGDNKFDFGEQIQIVLNYEAYACEPTSASTGYKAAWGCDGDIVITPVSYGNVAIDLKSPNIKVTTNGELSSCFSSSNTQYGLTVKNNGDGIAKNVTIEVDKRTASLSSLVTGSFYYSHNGNTTVFSPTLTSSNTSGAKTCLGNIEVSEFSFEIPFDLNPGEEVDFTWEMYQCCIDACLSEDNTKWSYEINYDNFCLTNSYTKTGTPESIYDIQMTVFTETPMSIHDQEKLPYIYTISTYENDYTFDNQGFYRLSLQYEEGIEIMDQTADLVWKSNSTYWTGTNQTYDNSTRTFTVDFPLPEPFTVEKSEILVYFTGNCNGSTENSDIDISLDIEFHPDPSCNSCQIPIVCEELTDTELECPDVNCEGLKLLDFIASRTSLGDPDNNLDGLPDTGGSIDSNNVRFNRLMVSDTLLKQFTGVIQTSGNPWDAVYAQVDFEKGYLFEPVTCNAVIYDSDQGTSFTIDNIPINLYNTSNSRIFRVSLTPSVYDPQISHLPLGSYDFGNGDSVILNLYTKMITNPGGSVEEVDLDTEFFATDNLNAWSSGSGRFACGNQGARVTLIGYFLGNTWAQNFNVKTCSRVIQQNFWMSIGDCCDNYNGGNLFPYEYRHWGIVNHLDVSYPAGYIVTDTYMRQRRTVRTNSTSTQTVDINPYYHTGTELKFDLSQYYENSGGNLYHSDDGFSGTVYVELAPTCDVPINQWQNIDWIYNFLLDGKLGGDVTDPYTTNPDKIKYNPTNLVLLSSNQYLDGVGRTVSWNLKVKNNTGNASAGNAWLHFKSPNSTVNVLHVIDSNGDTLNLSNDIYEIGTINENGSKTYTVVASYHGCAPDYIIAYSGYECAGYPNQFSDFTCPFTTFPLHVEPKSANQQVRITGETIGSGCSNTIELNAEIASVEFGHLDSISITATPIGNSMSYIDNTVSFNAPLTSSLETGLEPTFNGSGYIFDLTNSSSYLIDNALGGVLSVPNNRMSATFRFELDPSFSAGDYLLLKFESKSICGEEINPIYLAFDPSVQFNAQTSSNTTQENDETWGIAWTDYNGDGYDDLFVSGYADNQGSKMYQNNGDGTFTNVILGDLTQSGYSNVSSTWGDYNNDGHIDVFLSNNTLSANQLFTNNGDGTFSQLDNGDINDYGGYCHNAAWIDYDNDGHLDLFVTDYFETRFNLLYHNNQDGTFSQVSTNLSLHASKSIGATWADYDNDGDLDVYVPNTDGFDNWLYDNNGDGTFSLNASAITHPFAGNSVGCSWGDYNNDGNIDLYVANTGSEIDFLFKNNGDGTFSSQTNRITSVTRNSSGSSWVDVDNDGDLDLYITSDLGDSSIMYINSDGVNFVATENALSDVQGNSYPNSWSDYDRDGDMDLYVGNRNLENNKLFENDRASCNNFMCITLIGSSSNRSAIGARIRMKSNINGSDVWQLREVSAQTGGGAGSQNSLRQIFGLGAVGTADSIIINWPSGLEQVYTNFNLNECIEITEPIGNKICGFIYSDDNQDGVVDNNEIGIPGAKLRIDPNNLIFTADENGYFEVYLPNGDYTISQIINTGWNHSLPSSGNSIDLSLNDSDSCGIEFGKYPDCSDAELTILTGASAFRRGFNNRINIVVNNETSSTAENVEITLNLPEEIDFKSANIAPTSSSPYADGITYSWIVPFLNGFQEYRIEIQDSVTLLANIDDSLLITMNVNSSNSECNVNNNSSEIRDIFVGSIDPNDKQVFPSLPDDIYQVHQGEYLTYKIRYQNIGNYSASRVLILDSLSHLLDPNTITDLVSSHDFELKLIDNVMEFHFNNIYLPDSTTNIEASQGYVQFKIRPIYNGNHNELIKNTAHIQFDYNEFIVTNSVQTRYVDIVQLAQENLIISCYPNPTSDIINISGRTDEDNYTELKYLTMTDSYGRLLESIELNDMNRTFQLNLKNFAAGNYILNVTDKYGRKGRVKVIKL